MNTQVSPVVRFCPIVHMDRTRFLRVWLLGTHQELGGSEVVFAMSGVPDAVSSHYTERREEWGNTSGFNPKGLLVKNIGGDNIELRKQDGKQILYCRNFEGYQNLFDENIAQILKWAKDTEWLRLATSTPQSNLAFKEA